LVSPDVPSVYSTRADAANRSSWSQEQHPRAHSSQPLYNSGTEVITPGSHCSPWPY